MEYFTFSVITLWVILACFVLLAIVLAWLISPFIIVKHYPLPNISKGLSLISALCLIYSLGLIGIVAYFVILYIVTEINSSKKVQLND